MKNFNLPVLGAGAGLRHEHLDEIVQKWPAFKWFEVIAEDWMGIGGAIKSSFDRIRERYQIISHGVCLSIGSTDPLNIGYLKNLRKFLDEIKTPWTSDHLCFTMVDHTNLVDLIPLPFTSEAVKHIVERIKVVQNELERPFLLENVTRYITVSDREMPESEFISRILEEADCGLLLDVTNVHLNSKFHEYDAFEFIKSLPYRRVGQIHLAGWIPEENGEIIDSHDAPVPPEVWALFERTLELIGPTSVLIEWDSHLPDVERLLQETHIANRLLSKYSESQSSLEAA
ncbi:MAG: DUF692 domain-containing protein [Deltaproteobacteria bacterium]|nr:DUF692 domain-containing protein [Deltaproteobacteria bacterium]